MKSAKNVSFGVEIECNIPEEYRAQFNPGSYHRGNQIECAPSNGWNCQSDGSVRSTSASHFAAEVVSPKLAGEAGLVEIVQMLDLLDQIGARVNTSCGLHVHMSCQGMSQAELARTVKLFKIFELAFYSLNGTQTAARYASNYCKPAARWNGDRYASLNLKHVEDGHMEIRVWAGDLKPEVVVAAIYMATALVSRATNPEPIKTSHINVRKAKQVMAEFIRQFVKGEHMIVDDLDPADIFYTMMTQASAVNL